MAKIIDIYDSFAIKPAIKENNKKLMFSDSGMVKDETTLVCNVSATHSGTLINNRVYPPDAMRKGVRSWTHPYKKPVLTNHDEQGEPIGRVLKAKYVKTPLGIDSKEYKPMLKVSDGYGYIDLVLKITDPEAIKKVLDGRYETVSVRMSTNHAFCSICNTDWADEGPCEHSPGRKYEDELAYITTGDLTYREVSFVNIPADEYARVEGAAIGEEGIKASSPRDVRVYANNAEEKTLCDLEDDSNKNLYDYLQDETDDEEETIVHLIDRSIKVKEKQEKEDQMAKVEELTKDQLKDQKIVKEMIQEALDKAKADAESACAKELEALKKKLEENDSKDCTEQLEALKKEIENSKTTNVEELVKELQATKDAARAAQDAQVALSKEKEAITKERDQFKDELAKRDTERETLVDENVNLNAELHKLNAERLFDLKRTLCKPDVMAIRNSEDRNKKVEEFAQRSIDSLKDQINDLIVEQSAQPGAIKAKVENPGIEHEDNWGGKITKKTKKDESKGDTLNRLFGRKSA